MRIEMNLKPGAERGPKKEKDGRGRIAKLLGLGGSEKLTKKPKTPPERELAENESARMLREFEREREERREREKVEDLKITRQLKIMALDIKARIWAGESQTNQVEEMRSLIRSIHDLRITQESWDLFFEVEGMLFSNTLDRLKEENDPLVKFVRDVMKENPENFNPSYITANANTIKFNETDPDKKLKDVKTKNFFTYHDFLAQRNSLTREQDALIDGLGWTGQDGKKWKGATILAGKSFWEKLEDPSSPLHQFAEQFFELQAKALRGELEDTFAQERQAIQTDIERQREALQREIQAETEKAASGAVANQESPIFSQPEIPDDLRSRQILSTRSEKKSRHWLNRAIKIGALAAGTLPLIHTAKQVTHSPNTKPKKPPVVSIVRPPSLLQSPAPSASFEKTTKGRPATLTYKPEANRVIVKKPATTREAAPKTQVREPAWEEVPQYQPPESGARPGGRMVSVGTRVGVGSMVGVGGQIPIEMLQGEVNDIYESNIARLYPKDTQKIWDEVKDSLATNMMTKEPNQPEKLEPLINHLLDLFTASSLPPRPDETSETYIKRVLPTALQKAAQMGNLEKIKIP